MGRAVVRNDTEDAVMKQGVSSHVDAIVIGAGITGIYMVYKLQSMGFSVRGYEKGSDVGGTWYWNRYPGCRLDTESFTYAYFFLNDIVPDWSWSERFAGQEELLRYVRAAADKMDVRKNIQFNTGVVGATYDNARNAWTVELDDGSTATCTYLVTAVGLLSATRLPEFEGMGAFKGVSFHTSRWPADPDGGVGGARFSYEGKRVGVIGTGATGVQLIPEIAKTAQELFVFQRSPNWCTPLRNSPLSKEEMEEIRGTRKELLAHVKTTPFGFIYSPVERDGVQDAPEDREAFLEKLYSTPGYGIWLGNYRDIITCRETNDFVSKFVARKIRQRVKDPKVAEKLVPKHPFGSKRIPMETNYYEAYNRENVHLVDVKEDPIEAVTPTGLKTRSAHYDLDMIIYATGFVGVTGAIERIDFKGKQGVRLADVWDVGPVTYLGLQVSGFPNLFTLAGPHNGATFCNVGVCGNLQVEWLCEMLDYLRKRKLNFVEANEDAQEKWTAEIYADFEKTLLTASDDAWWVKVKRHPDGRVTRRALTYIGGGPTYRKICDEIAENGYPGFRLARM
jgi:cation diffusion facilitator CzcD-associated flavoprotein CzcO